MGLTLQIVLTNLAVILAMMLCLWLISLRVKDASIVDVIWGPGFVLVAWVSLAQAPVVCLRGLIIATLTTLWGLRLGIYIGWRNHGQGEDRRYRAMRKAHRSRFWWVSLFTVFGLQGILMWVISLVIQSGIATAECGEITWFGVLGILLWCLGFSFEVVADWQLARFTGDPGNRGKTLMTGLWRYSRHPNYFGESVIWWGLFLTGLSVPGTLWTIVCPALMTFLLLRVSGVPMLERKMSARRPDYEAYRESTSSFFPLPKRRR